MSITDQIATQIGGKRIKKQKKNETNIHGSYNSINTRKTPQIAQKILEQGEVKETEEGVKYILITD